ncbi:unnamed protein product [Rhizophagus irregularis]|uniref:Uncharacterized protein n=1 Tax=Rhizophagus irregularis TaxID=588596 RepID=A0A916E7C4_9GLOM|nr:unnamed protein product [Rhizophagus irregularis]CAB5193751.1 unnamed protein product [Rhizophagus irregularis]CAB5360330.1 unnamed protein product [Rhizophagus irregularis]
MWKESRLKFMPKEDMPPPEGMKFVNIMPCTHTGYFYCKKYYWKELRELRKFREKEKVGHFLLSLHAYCDIIEDDFIYSNPYYLRPPSPPSPPPSPPSSSLSRFLVQSATKEVKEVEKIEKVEKVNNNDIPQLIQLHIKRLENKSFKFTFNEDKAKFIK